MTIEKEARKILFEYFDAMTDEQIDSGTVVGIEKYIEKALQKKQDRIEELEKELKETKEWGENHYRKCIKNMAIEWANKELKCKIKTLESALNEIHRLCRTLEPLDATIRIIEVKEKAIGGVS